MRPASGASRPRALARAIRPASTTPAVAGSAPTVPAPPLSPSERVQAGALRTLLALPPAVQRRLAGGPVRRDGLELDPEIALVLACRPPSSGGWPRAGAARRPRARPESARSAPDPRPSGRRDAADVAAARDDRALRTRLVAGRPAALAAVEDRTVAGADEPSRPGADPAGSRRTDRGEAVSQEPLATVAPLPARLYVPAAPPTPTPRAAADRRTTSTSPSRTPTRPRASGSSATSCCSTSFADDLPLLVDFLGVPDPSARRRASIPRRASAGCSTSCKRLIAPERPRARRAPSSRTCTGGTRQRRIARLPRRGVAGHPGPHRSSTSARVLPPRASGPLPPTALAPPGPAAVDDALAAFRRCLRRRRGTVRERTGGNPFFIEEVVRSLISGGNSRGLGADRPGAVGRRRRGAAPIDRLGSARSSAADAAVIGKEFSAVARRVAVRS